MVSDGVDRCLIFVHPLVSQSYAMLYRPTYMMKRATKTVPWLQDDLTATLPESSWWVADDHEAEVASVLAAWSGERTIHVLDLFGYSGSISRAFEKKGYRAVQYDVLLGGRSHDILSKRGFLYLVRS